MGLLDDAIREHLDLKRRRGADPTEIERAEREALGPVRREPSMSAALSDELPSATAPAAASPDDYAFPTELGEFTGEPTTTVAPSEDGSAPGIAAPQYADPTFDEFTATEPPASMPPKLEPTAPVELEPDPPVEPLPESEPKPKRRHLFGRHRHDGDEPPFPADLSDDVSFITQPGAVKSADGEAVSRAQPMKRDESPAAGHQPPPLRITPEGDPGNTIEYDVEGAFLAEDQADTPEDEDILEETPEFLADTPDHDRLWFEQKPPPDFDFED
jgi:hypothetical protein